MKLKNLVVSSCNVRDLSADDPELGSLEGSIKEFGVINKIILRKAKTPADKFEIIGGSRRYRALLNLHEDDYELDESDYVIMDVDDKQAFMMSIQENQQRLDLSPIELNRAALRLNSMGYSDQEIARLLNITKFRLKRICALSQDFNKMPEPARTELGKPLAVSLLNDAHWSKIREVEDSEVIKDVVDYIIDKQSAPREIPTIIKGMEKRIGGGRNNSQTPSDQPTPEVCGPIEYSHKGELKLEEKDGKTILRVLGKEEDSEVPLDHYMEYLRHPAKFRCYVTFKLKIKPTDDAYDSAENS